MTNLIHVFYWTLMFVANLVVGVLPIDPTLFTYVYHGSVHSFGLCDLGAMLMPFVAFAFYAAIGKCYIK